MMMLSVSNNLFDSILWFCASGRVFFVGAILLIATAVIHAALNKKRWLVGVYFFYMISILAIIVSSTPLPLLFYGVWTVAFIVCLLIRKNRRLYGLLLLTAVSLGAVAMELPWHFSPAFPVDGIQQIYVIGDSVSAGMGNNKEHTWSVLLAEEVQIPVVNLAVAGATCDTALRKQVPQVNGSNNLVFLEIGGNDLLNHNPPAEYEQYMRTIIRQLQSSSNTIAWFELPLLPHYYKYGRIQRTLANEYGIKLVPKSLLTTVFSTEGATSDGIHLTGIGHTVMTQQIVKLLK